MRLPWPGLLLVGATAACAAVLGLDAGSPADGDATQDGAIREDASVDAGSDGAIPSDAEGADGSVQGDAGSDVAADHASDVGPPPPRQEPGIVCGAATCVPGTTKCTRCGDAGPQCAGWNNPLSGCGIFLCDDTADCVIGSACCAASAPPPDFVSGASCRSVGCGNDHILCDPGKDDCKFPSTCKPYGALYACQ